MNEKEIYDLKMEATFDDAEAQLKLGSYYLLNNNISEGIHWIKAASQQELPQAIHRLAEIYETGIYIQENKKFAYELFKLGAGHQHIPSVFKLGTYLFYGKAGEQDRQKGYALIEFAANNNYAEAENEISGFYMEGDYVEKNVSVAIFWLKRAVEHNSLIAQFNLGMLYFDEKSYEQALELFYASSNQGYADAKHVIGIMHAEGLGVEKDFQFSINWCLDALKYDHEHQGAMTTLFKLIINLGKGSQQDFQLFQQYLNIASQYRNFQAIKLLEHPRFKLQKNFQELSSLINR